MKTFAGFGQRFATDRDSLPQTDADRAFHLVSLAADAIDYQLPFADAEHAKELVAHSTPTASTQSACAPPTSCPA